MPGYVIHIAIAQEYAKKHKENCSYEFIKGVVAPDFTTDKQKTHYGISPAYTNLKKFLEANELDSDYNKGFFLHLVSDYLFYNHYLDRINKKQLHSDYDFINKYLIEKYDVKLIDDVKDKVYFESGNPEIVTKDLACNFIDKVSSLNINDIKKEVITNEAKWNSYKNLVKTVSYTYGVWDILRAKDLKDLDREIQLSRQEGSKYFGVGIYDENLCQALRMNTPLKSLEDRMKIMENIRGVDFVFPIYSLDKHILKSNATDAYKLFMEKEKHKSNGPKKYQIGYAPGTYDLFHAGHLENLTLAASECEKLIVGIKSDELVFKHKNRKPVLSADERTEILRHFKFVHDVYKYHTRDLQISSDWIESKYNQKIDAVFLGSDLKKDFESTKGINIIYTPRDPEKMKTRSTTAYRKLHLSRDENMNYTGNIDKYPRVSEYELKKDDEEIEELK